MKNNTLVQLSIISIIVQFFMIMMLPIETNSLLKDLANYGGNTYLQQIAEFSTFKKYFHLVLFPMFILIAPMFGYLSDYHNKRNLLITCHILFMIGYITALLGELFSLNSLILFSIMLLRLGLCTEAITLSLFSYVKDKNKVATAFALFFMLLLAFSSLAKIVNDMIATFNSSPLPLIITGVGVEGILLLWLALNKSIKMDIEKHQIKTTVSLSRALHSLLMSPQIFLLFGLLFMLTFAVSLYYQSIELYLQSLNHLSNSEIAAYDHLTFFAKIIGLSVVFLMLVGRYAMIPLTVATLIVSIVGFEILLDFSYLHYSWIFGALLAGTLFVSYKLIWFLIMQLSPLSLTGLTQSLVKAIWVSAFMLSNILGILLINFSPIYLLSLSLLGIVVTTGTLMILWRNQKQWSLGMERNA